MREEDVVVLERVTKTLGSRVVLRNVSMSVGSGDVVGVFGANGSGKTTLLRVLVGLIRPDVGRARVAKPKAHSCSHLCHTVYFAGGGTLPGGLRVGRWACLWGMRGSMVNDARRFGELSRGQRQAVGLRIALDRAPLQLVVLDEPWEGLDPDAARWLERVLVRRHREGAAIVVSSHRLANLAAIGTRFIVMREGRVIEVPADGTVSPAVMEARLDRAYRKVIHSR